MSSFSEGITSGLKYAALAQELKTGQLKQAQYKLDAAHTNIMNQLDEAHAQSDLQTQSLNQQLLQSQLEGSTLANKEKSATSAARVATENLGPQKAQADIAQTSAETERIGASTQAIGAQTQATALENTLREQQVQSNIGKAAGQNDKVFTTEDINSLTQNALDSMGVKTKPGDATWNLWRNQISGHIAETQRQNSIVQSQNADIAQQRKAETINKLSDLGYGDQSTQDPSDLIRSVGKAAGFEPGIVDAAVTSGKNKLAARKALIEAKQVEIQAGKDDPYTKSVKESLAQVQSSLAGLQAKEDSGTKLSKNAGGGVFSSGTDEITLKKTLQAKEKLLQKNLEDYYSGKAKTTQDFTSQATGGAFKPNVGVQTSGNIPTIKTKADYDKLSPGAVFIDASDNKQYRKPA